MNSNDLLQYKENIQHIQLLLYTSSDLTSVERNSIKEVIDYIQSKLKLYYFKKMFFNDKNYKNIHKLLEEKYNKTIKLQKLLHDKRIDTPLTKDIYNLLNLLQESKNILEKSLFNNLVAKLQKQCNISKLCIQCENILGNNISNNIDIAYRIINNQELYNKVQNYFNEEKELKNLDWSITILQEDIENLKFKIDHYNEFMELQKFLDIIREIFILPYKKNIIEVKEKLKEIKEEIDDLKGASDIYSRSSLISKIRYSQRNKYRELKLSKLIETKNQYDLEYDNYKEELRQNVGFWRTKLIHKINDFIKSQNNRFNGYIKLIEQSKCEDDILDDIEIFIYKNFDCSVLNRECLRRNNHLEDLQIQKQSLEKQHSKLFEHFDETVRNVIFQTFILNKSNLLNEILSCSTKKLSDNNISPNIALLILKLIKDTDELSPAMMEQLLTKEDKKSLKNEYELEIEYYLKNELNYLSEFTPDILFTNYNSSNKLNLVKIKY